MLPLISQLFIYPIKSCAGIAVSNLHFDHKGPLYDRRWMLVDAHSGEFLTQRELPLMAIILTRIDNGRVWAEQTVDSELEKSFCLPVEGSLQEVTIWSDNVKGLDCGDEAAHWFSRILDRECRLIYQGECERAADLKYAELGTKVSYADGFPLLVVSETSIEALNKECIDAEVSARNFRPNIVIAGTEAFAEIDWQGLIANQVLMSVVKPCERCVIPTINPETGLKQAGILPVLLRFCRREKKIYFGQNLTFKYSKGMELSIGDSVKINSK